MTDRTALTGIKEVPGTVNIVETGTLAALTAGTEEQTKAAEAIGGRKVQTPGRHSQLRPPIPAGTWTTTWTGIAPRAKIGAGKKETMRTGGGIMTKSGGRGQRGGTTVSRLQWRVIVGRMWGQEQEQEQKEQQAQEMEREKGETEKGKEQKEAAGTGCWQGSEGKLWVMGAMMKRRI